MPFMSIFKNYAIDNENDIPEEFLEEIKGEKEYPERSYPSEYIPGKQGQIITDISCIRDIFSDEDCFYAGHGTDETNVEKIFNEGLYAKDPEDVRGYMDTLRGLDSTVVEWGAGSNDLFDNQQAQLNNWPHKDAKSIIIVELPLEYIMYFARYSNNGDEFSSFYIKNNLDEGYQGHRLRPEFIRGVYDAEKNAFIPNNNFYKNLPKEEKERLLEQVKKQYIYRYAESINVAPSQSEFKLPLNDEELKKADYEWYRVQYKKMLEDMKENQNVENNDSVLIEKNDELLAMFSDDTKEKDLWGEDSWGEYVEEDSNSHKL